MRASNQYGSEIGKDENVVVVAFDIKDNDPAKDLSQFIETGHECIDVDVSPGPTKEGSYKVFVELERNSKLFDSIDKMLKDIRKLKVVLKSRLIDEVTEFKEQYNPKNIIHLSD